jgi:hypothetical protein
MEQGHLNIKAGSCPGVGLVEKCSSGGEVEEEGEVKVSELAVATGNDVVRHIAVTRRGHEDARTGLQDWKMEGRGENEKLRAFFTIAQETKRGDLPWTIQTGEAPTEWKEGAARDSWKKSERTRLQKSAPGEGVARCPAALEAGAAG